MKKLAVCLLAGFLSLAGMALAQGAAERIAFVDPQGRLATIDQDGTNLRILTPPGGHFQFPAWGPDGVTLAAIASEAGAGNVYTVKDVEGATPRQLYSSYGETPVYLSWSPDGKTLSFIANHPEGFGLHLMSVDDGADRILAVEAPFFWQWAAGSRKLLIHTGFVGEGARLGFTSTSQDDLQENLAAPGFFQAPGISASGRYIAYAELTELGAGRLVLQNNPESAAPAVRREVPHRGLVAFGWSPARDELAFISPPPDEAGHFFGPIRLLDAETGLLEPLTGNTAIAFFWSPDGRYLAYLTLARGGGPQVRSNPWNAYLLISTRRVQAGTLGLDLRVIDLAEQSEQLLATITPTPLFVQQFLPFFDQYALSHQLWSPGSDALVLPILGPDGQSYVTVITLGGELRTIARGDMPSWNRR